MTGQIEIFENSLRTSISRTRWLLSGGFIAFALSVLLIFYAMTVGSAVEIWFTRDTYGYAFAVLPIAAYIVWLRREHFRASVPVPTFLGLLVVVIFAALWALGQRQDILELKHLAFSGIVAGIIISAVGWSNSAHFWLPLGYLFLLAPVGTPLLPTLQDITTFLGTAFLRLGQIPFYADGHLIEVATGKYEVAPGCAGLNFVLAMATVAPVYCEIMYTNPVKKFIALGCMMLMVPVANGIRVFGIIAIAEYTNRAIDISADHLFYGWAFFSGIVLVMFWFGSWFADAPPSPAPHMPWGGHYTMAELLADPIIIRMQLVLFLGLVLGVLPTVLDVSKIL